jgi:regulator of protease activity HflC (stomatin/prohibitin superfamily)
MQQTLVVLTCVGGLVVLVLLVFMPMAIKIVREYQRLVVFRLGK